jgi:hypothetical protein
MPLFGTSGTLVLNQDLAHQEGADSYKMVPVLEWAGR